MHWSRPGDLLAGRYRLQDLLSEKRHGRFWRADDEVLGRPVAIHVLSADDERAVPMMDAARASATVGDPRLLRVLDADITDTIAFVVNEWGEGISLDHVLTAEGPLTPRRAAIVAEEVAETIAVAHARGFAHGRLNPENVLFDPHGSVRIIGFAVEAALHGSTPEQRVDVTDLAALLYAGITGKWAGATASRVDPAPTDHGRLLRARQVRAGVPRLLDDLCDEVLAQPGHEVSAHDILAELAAYVGEPVDLSATAGLPPLVPASPQVTQPAAEDAPTGIDEHATVAMPAPGRHRDDDGPATEAMPPLTAAPGDGPADETDDGTDDGDATQPGLPVFDDDWHKPRKDTPPPPPPHEEEPPKPLFADEPRVPREQLAPEPAPRPAASWPDTGPQPQHRPTAPAGHRGHAAATAAATSTARPWDPAGPSVEVAEEPGDRVPGRNWLRLAIGIAIVAALFICIALAYNLGRGRSPLGTEPDEPAADEQTSASARPSPVRGVVANDFDPLGDPPAEYPDLVGNAVDGDPTTSWYTSTYDDQIGLVPRSLKPGVGLVLDLGDTYAVDSLDLSLRGAPTSISAFVLPNAPDPVTPPGGQGLSPDAQQEVSGTDGRLQLRERPEGQYVLVWLTSLPRTDDGRYRGEITEVSVLGDRVR